MAEVPDVSAIVEQVKARIKHIEAELARHERLSDELARRRDALAGLEGAARSRVSRARRGRRPAPTPPPGMAQPARPARPARASGRAPGGQNKAKVLESAQGRAEDRVRDLQEHRDRDRDRQHAAHQARQDRRVTKAQRGYRLPD